MPNIFWKSAHNFLNYYADNRQTQVKRYVKQAVAKVTMTFRYVAVMDYALL